MNNLLNYILVVFLVSHIAIAQQLSGTITDADSGVPLPGACLFDNKYVFNADGSFSNVVGAESWIETWQGAAADGCAAPVFPHDGTATATYEYDKTAEILKLTGKGAYLGLPKAYNLGELTAPGDASDEITYIAVLSSDGSTLEIDIKVNDGNNAHWSFKLVKE